MRVGIDMITSQKAFKAAIERQLGGPGLTQEARLADAIRARRCRNVFFNAIAPAVVKAACPPDVIAQAQTKITASPVIVTDMLNFDEPYRVGFFPGVIWQLARVFTSGVGFQEDFFGAGNFLCSLFTLGHYQTNPVAGTDAPSTKAHFMPFLLRPGQIFQFNWEILDFASVPGASVAFNPEADLRGLQVLKPDDELGFLCGTLRQQVCGYIEKWDAETFILDLRIPIADFPAAGATRVYSTPLQERPLLIYGIGTNINGAQVLMQDDNLRWEFCAPPSPPTKAIVAGALVAGVYPNVNGIPLSVVANNGDATIHEAYNMLPVPHLLAPNTSISFRLTNGLRPTGTAATYQQAMTTTSNSLHSTGDGHIALLCRTV